MPLINRLGHKYNQLTVESFEGIGKHRKSYWKCKCVCGNVVVTTGASLQSGHIKSCGCLRITLLTKHGEGVKGKRTRTYNIWGSMIARCCNVFDHDYKDYGGRGITVCEEWKDFRNFKRDMGEALQRMTLDRIDNNKGYCKENCQWVSRRIQAQNTRRSVIIEYNGVKKCMAEWARIIDMPPTALRYKLKCGLTLKELMK